ncbi:hypothetical protein ACX80N_07480 [Arthrobacter sp. MDT2-16]
MTARDTPSPEPVLRLLGESGLPEEPLLLDAVRHIGALGEGPAPDASAELGQLMADGGRAPRSRRNRRRITFIGGALAVSMGAGMSGVAAGTLHLPSGLGDAVDSIVHFTARDGAGRTERPAHPQTGASEVRAPSGRGAAGAADEHRTAGPPGDKPPGAPAASGSAPSTSDPAAPGTGTSVGPDVLPASGAHSSSAVSGVFAVSPAVPLVAPSAQEPAGPVPPAPAPPLPPARDTRITTAPAGPPAPVAVPVPKKGTDTDIAEPGPDRVEQRKVGPVRAGQDTTGPGRAGQDTVGPVKAGQDTTGPAGKNRDETGHDRKIGMKRLDVGPAADEVQSLPAPQRPGISWLRTPAAPSNPVTFHGDAPVAREADSMELFLAETFVDPAAVPPEEYPVPDPWAGDVVPEGPAVPEVPDTSAAGVVPEVSDAPAGGIVPEVPGEPAPGAVPEVPDAPAADVLPSPGDVPDPAVPGAPAAGVIEAGNGLPAGR